jgi:hypothetical protein
VSKERIDLSPRPLPYRPTQSGSERLSAAAEGDSPGEQGIDAIVGRSAADYLLSMPADAAGDVAPEAVAPPPPVASEFARALLERIEVARSRVAGETAHLDSVEQVAANYRPGERPWLRLLP